MRRGGSGADEVIAKTMASALFLSKSVWQLSAHGGASAAVAPDSATESSLLAARCFAVAPDKDQPGGFFPVDDTQAGEEAPTTFAVGKTNCGPRARASHKSDAQ